MDKSRQRWTKYLKKTVKKWSKLYKKGQKWTKIDNNVQKQTIVDKSRQKWTKNRHESTI